MEWRDEKRLGPLLNEWNAGWDYWLLIKGTVTEKLNLEMIEQKREATMEGSLILDRLKDDGKPNVKREQWKKLAMERVAEKHQQDYDNKDFEDPLGVAVQQTFGIGLGFNFDHMRELEEGEKPSIRRLQARAAKSAIRKAQELYDPNAAKQELEGLDEDPVARDKRAAELREATEVEIRYLAQRLSELVPTGKSEEFLGKNYVQQFRQTGFRRKSTNEYTMDDPFANDSATEMLLGISRPSGSEEQAQKEKHDDDEEFIDAYIEQLESTGNKDDDDNDETVVLA